MALLIQMRRRIHTIETIKKVTNAMRLIAMSGHSNLKNKEVAIKQYAHIVEKLFYQIKALIPETFDPFARSGITPRTQPLVILVGSHKGLCGTFNEALLKLFATKFPPNEVIDIIALGNKAIHYCQKNYPNLLIKTFEKFSYSTLKDTVWQLSKDITHTDHPYQTVLIASNYLKTFFVQQPAITQLLPLDPNKEIGYQADSFEDYIWEQPVEYIAQDLAMLYIEAQLHEALFKSLIAEQAARFVSMDNATRNAEGLLDVTKLQYNKLRQAKITREITELASSI